MTSIGAIKIIDNHLYIPNTRLHKEKTQKENIGYTPLNNLLTYTLKKMSTNSLQQQAKFLMICLVNLVYEPLTYIYSSKYEQISKHIY